MLTGDKRGIGLQCVVDQNLAQQVLGQAVGQRVLVVEMPVRIVGGEQQHVVGADLLDDALQLVALAAARRTAATVRRTCSRA